MDYGMSFTSLEDNYSGNSLRRTRSIELRAGKLYKTCDCIKRNGLQSDCRRSECQDRFCCMSSSPLCNPSQSARLMANHTMGIGARNYSVASYYQDNMDMSNNMHGMSKQSAQYGMGDFNGGRIIHSSDQAMMAYYGSGGPAEPSQQFMSAPQAPPYGDCQPTCERPGYGEYSSYGPINVGPADQQEFSGYGRE